MAKGLWPCFTDYGTGSSILIKTEGEKGKREKGCEPNLKSFFVLGAQGTGKLNSGTRSGKSKLRKRLSRAPLASQLQRLAQKREMEKPRNIKKMSFGEFGNLGLRGLPASYMFPFKFKSELNQDWILDHLLVNKESSLYLHMLDTFPVLPETFL